VVTDSLTVLKSTTLITGVSSSGGASVPLFRAYYGTRYVAGKAGLEFAADIRVSGVWLDAEQWKLLAEFALDVAEHLDSLGKPAP
jgi:hypothetical protein